MEQKENMPANAGTAAMQMVPMAQTMPASFLTANNLEEAQRAAMMLSSSDLVPDMYKTGGKISSSAQQTREKAVANCLIALDMAQRMNANPLMIMQNLYIVQGKPGWSSSFLISTVNSCGRYKPLRFVKGVDGEVEIAGKKTPNRTCTAYTTEKGSEDILEGATISMAMAKAEGWTSKNGSKWLTMPEQMLMYRAASFWVRTYAPELSNGMKTAEEWQDAEIVEEIPTAQAAAYSDTHEDQQPPIGHHEAPEQEQTPAAAPQTQEPAAAEAAQPKPNNLTPGQQAIADALNQGKQQNGAQQRAPGF